MGLKTGLPKKRNAIVAEQQLAHIVYFTLQEKSPELVPDLDREVNQRDFDVALHLVFSDRQSHDLYQVSDRHQEFIATNRDNWSQVRVYDSYLG